MPQHFEEFRRIKWSLRFDGTRSPGDAQFEKKAMLLTQALKGLVVPNAFARCSVHFDRGIGFDFRR